jgi:predicted restriction endonuclease
MTNKWQTATLASLKRYSIRHKTRMIPSVALLQEEPSQITSEIGSQGTTPWQTLSKTLQELRRIGIIHHVARGIDLLLDVPVVVDAEDFPEKALDVAVDSEQLLVSDVPTSDAIRLARYRKGQAVVRKHTLGNYEHRCALCDVDNDQLLVASHIPLWSDDAVARGALSNIICLCKMHDARTVTSVSQMI